MLPCCHSAIASGADGLPFAACASSAASLSINVVVAVVMTPPDSPVAVSSKLAPTENDGSTNQLVSTVPLAEARSSELLSVTDQVPLTSFGVIEVFVT